MDSRSRERAGQLPTLAGYYDRVFCLSCGAPSGWVSPGTAGIVATCQDCAAHDLVVFCALCHDQAPSTARQPKTGETYVCEPCFERSGTPPGMLLSER